MKTFCTDTSEAWFELDNKQIKQAYKDLSKQAQTKNKPPSRLTKQAIAQLIDQGRFATSYQHAIMASFRKDPSTLTKKEKKVAKLCYHISQSDFMEILNRMILVNDRAYATLKVIAEIRGLINTTHDLAQNTGAKLNINLSQLPTKQPPEKAVEVSAAQTPALSLDN